ncbi:molybdate transport system ATP-binding protein [Maribacter vaceletii]|uniref:Molybdate transport system ATP-binding protein n=1 Tax=Maribacter vaceletii TaxID=1206816 RepID=A0A495E6L3_9FLAO|nr:ATP-binding cassette domain-containing protein [Maribacter vaceletii]RKR12426.1 molybdate transport system ATP-binding protein [Maribacter vaceletii]
MKTNHHWGIYITNTSNKKQLIHEFLKNSSYQNIESYVGHKIALFSKITIAGLIEDEDRHDTKIITKNSNQSLKSMSSGEQKKALLKHLFSTDNKVIILDNVFDNLDIESQINIKKTLTEKADKISFIQLISRKEDTLPFLTHYAALENETLKTYSSLNTIPLFKTKNKITGSIPPPILTSNFIEKTLIKLKNVTVSFGDKTVLKNINWQIDRGSFWELIGANGSGKTTILSMLTGENPKGYGQDLYIFGKKKGSGESIWDIKKRIGYFTPSMTDKFKGNHTIENMLISGYNDSIGLYTKPTDVQKQRALEWLKLLQMEDLKDTLFKELSMGQKRVIMTTRAMVKHPELLILDEPTAGLDDFSASILVSLVNKMAQESQTTILFVSHRKESNLTPQYQYLLTPSTTGSVGTITKL